MATTQTPAQQAASDYTRSKLSGVNLPSSVYAQGTAGGVTSSRVIENPDGSRTTIDTYGGGKVEVKVETPATTTEKAKTSSFSTRVSGGVTADQIAIPEMNIQAQQQAQQSNKVGDYYTGANQSLQVGQPTMKSIPGGYEDRLRKQSVAIPLSPAMIADLESARSEKRLAKNTTVYTQTPKSGEMVDTTSKRAKQFPSSYIDPLLGGTTEESARTQMAWLGKVQAKKEQLRIVPDPTKNPWGPMNVAKSTLGFGYDLATAPAVLPGNVVVATKGLSTREGRIEWKQALGETPGSIAKQADLRKPEGWLFVGTAALGVRAIASKSFVAQASAKRPSIVSGVSGQKYNTVKDTVYSDIVKDGKITGAKATINYDVTVGRPILQTIRSEGKTTLGGVSFTDGPAYVQQTSKAGFRKYVFITKQEGGVATTKALQVTRTGYKNLGTKTTTGNAPIFLQKESLERLKVNQPGYNRPDSLFQKTKEGETARLAAQQKNVNAKGGVFTSRSNTVAIQTETPAFKSSASKAGDFSLTTFKTNYKVKVGKARPQNIKIRETENQIDITSPAITNVKIFDIQKQKYIYSLGKNRKPINIIKSNDLIKPNIKIDESKFSPAMTEPNKPASKSIAQPIAITEQKAKTRTISIPSMGGQATGKPQLILPEYEPQGMGFVPITQRSNPILTNTPRPQEARVWSGTNIINTKITPARIIGSSFKSNQFQRNISIVNSAQSSKTREIFKPSQVTRVDQTPRSRVNLTTDQDIAQVTKQDIITKQTTIFKPIITTTTKSRGRYEPPRPEPPRPKIIKPFFSFGSQKKEAGFKTLIRRGGEWSVLPGKALSQQEAINYGTKVVGTTAAASFKLKASNESLGSFKGGGNIKDFYTKNDVFIERRERRIKSSGEKREITFKGIQASKNKRRWF